MISHFQKPLYLTEMSDCENVATLFHSTSGDSVPIPMWP